MSENQNNDLIITPKYLTNSDDFMTPKQRDNIDDRDFIMKKCIAGMQENASEQSKEFLLEIIRNTRSNIFFWLEYFSWCFDPRKRVYLPFIPYDFQKDLIKELLASINNGEDILIEKSRDMGVTYTSMFVFQWLWQFHPGFSFHIGSKKEDNVDILGDPSSMMEKIRINIRKQPGFLLPDGFNLDKQTSHLKILNKQIGSTITGESSNPDFSRSGRYSAVLFDELAFWKDGNEAWSAAGDSTPCRIAVSTPYGKFNKFADLRFSGKTKVCTLHWKLHPEKSDEWYEKETKRRTREEVARELDINYIASAEGAIYTEFDPVRHISKDLRKEFMQINSITRVWDTGLTSAVVFMGKYGNTVLVFDEFVQTGMSDPDFITSVITYSNEVFPDAVFTDIIDIAARKRDKDHENVKISFIDRMWIDFGIRAISKYRGLVEDGIQVVKRKLWEPGGFRIDEKCATTIEALAGGYRRKEPPRGSNKETPPAQEHPYEDVMDCVRYYAVDYFKPTRKSSGSRGSRAFK